MLNLSIQPVKGTADWDPEEFAIRKYIFDTWREVCYRFGYREYLTPLVEYADLYREKSGEDIGGKELTVFRDRGDRELAIRPEMTPSVVRMVLRDYVSQPKPIRLFSIANFFRNEKPQRGRNREFWQLNYDLFGSESINSDLEILVMAIEMMLTFISRGQKESAEKNQKFYLYLNDRRILDDFISSLGITKDRIQFVLRIMDKWSKLDNSEIQKKFLDLGLNRNQFEQINSFMNWDPFSEEFPSDFSQDLKDVISRSVGFSSLNQIISSLEGMGYRQWVRFKPGLVRGFDYYDGMVFEVFDNYEDNKRSIFGGGRYNALADLFGKDNIPAVGCAPGDETLKLFLSSWNLLPKDLVSKTSPQIYLPILSGVGSRFWEVAQQLRQEGNWVEMGLEEQSVSVALRFADKKGFAQVVLFGEEECQNNHYRLRDMVSGQEDLIDLRV